jgi:hypothetical protein
MAQQTPRTRPPNAAGPFAEETADSRIGLQTGLSGAENVTRKWRVYTVSPIDNPVATITVLEAKDGGVALGDRFPKFNNWGDGTYVLYYFTIVDHWPGTNVWTLMGHYVPSYVTTFATTLWTINIQSSLETVRVYTDRNGKGIGIPRYLTATNNVANFQTRSLNRGTVGLVLAGTTQGAPDFGDPFAANLPRHIVGADVPKRTSTIVLRKVISSWRWAAAQQALNAKRFVNSDRFFVHTTSLPRPLYIANDPGTVLFQDLILEDVPVGTPTTDTGVGLSRVTDGPSFRVTMVFKYDPDGWQLNLPHMHRWDDGTESPVTRITGNPGNEPVVEEEFEVVGETSLSALVGAFTPQ